MKSKIIEKIKEYDRIIIHRHVRPDPDAYGSQGSLQEIIKANYPTKTVLSTGFSEPTLSYLKTMDEVSNEQFENALVIVCDTANEERIDDQRYLNGAYVIKIDHHPNVTPYGDIIWVNTDSSSTSEMIYELFKVGEKEENWTLPTEGARLIYAGIIGDTGRFLFSNTTKRTFEVASDLINYDFSRQDLHNEFYKTTPKVAKMQGFILYNYEKTDEGVGHIAFTKKQLEEFGVTSAESSQLVGVLGNIEGIKVWVMFVEENENDIRVRIRSKGPVINQVAREFNGGGHPLASGATIYAWNDKEKVLKALDEVCVNDK